VRVLARDPSPPKSLAGLNVEIIQGDVRDASPALLIAPARMVHEDAAHQLGGHGEKVGAVLPLHSLVVHQTQVGFVDERCRL